MITSCNRLRYDGAVRSFALFLGTLCAVLVSLTADAQQTPGSIQITVGVAGAAPERFEIEVIGTALGTLSAVDGEFTVDGLRPGNYQVIAQALGFEPQTVEITVSSGATAAVKLELALMRFNAPGVTVTAMRPDLQPEATLSEQQLRQTNPRDVGEMVRDIPGVDSVRRGPLGLDPVVRGMRESQVGVYLDDARIFPAGPARMDSALSHFDPGTVESVQVVKGPYALTWGAGNLTAMRASTMPLPHAVRGTLHGNIWGGYSGNLDASEGVAQLYGTAGSTSYWVGGAMRAGSDYKAGNGETIPGDYRSGEGRAKVGFALSNASFLQFSGAYQDQRDVDYPGRLLDATLFRTTYLAGSYDYQAGGGAAVHVSGYYNDVDHEMNNDEKPTAGDMAGRVPPFGLDIDLVTGSRTWGGRAVAEFDASDAWRLEAGADVYSVNRDARRRVGRRSNDATILEDVVWPDANTRDAGMFVKAETTAGSVDVTATGRVDFVSSTADETIMSDFFKANTEGPYDVTETNLSGALTASQILSSHWNLAAGIGTAVRTADASERYSDRFPSSKMQTSAEFMGNPQLLPERGTQFDVWLDGRYANWSLSVGGFYRTVADYITIEATDLPRKLPLSPPIVFRYVNGDARFWGAEGTLSYFPARRITLTASSAYLWGQDTTLDEPVLGISPFRVDFAARYDGGPWYAKGAVHSVADQERVATSRFETPTQGATTVDLLGGWRSPHGFELIGGIRNLFDVFYVNHLNAKNPFTRQQIAEAGRVAYVRAIYSF
jgi:iron complex outermembrane receptor protein